MMISGTRFRSVASSLRDGIAAGRWHAGARLPSEADLSRLHGVSRGTVVKALDQLVSEGLVTRQQGRGSFVAPPALRRTPGGLASFSETVERQGRRAIQRLVRIEEVGRAEALACGHGEASLRLVRLRLLDAVPCAIHASVVPAALLAALPERDAELLHAPEGSAFSLYQALARWGRPVVRASEQVGARLASAEEAAMLGLAAPPAALLVVLRRGFDEAGRQVETTQAAYRPDLYRFEAELLRGAAPLPHRPGPESTDQGGNVT